MKIITLITASLLLAINCHSQITTIEEKEKTIEIQKYDSLKSLRIDNAPQHVGQTLFMRGTEYAKENNFFMTFFTKKIEEWENGTPYTYKPIPGKREGETVSSYAELVGKYYKVLSVEVGKIDPPYSTFYWLQLVGDDNIPFYYEMTSGLNAFVTLGYYEKMKKTFVGKEFYSLSSHHQKIDSDEDAQFPPDTRFKCIDIAVKIGTDEPIFAVLENEKYGKIKGDIMNGQKLQLLGSSEKRNALIKKYGAKIGEYVVHGKIVIGMTKQMVKDARGLPDDINSTQGSYGTHEQWVYGERYIYFKNGIVTSIQD